MSASASPRRAAPAKAPKPAKPPKSATTPKAAKAPKRPAVVDAIDNARVIELRSHPRSFAYIAEELGLGNAHAAFDAFLSALGTKTASEQRTLRTEENGRLDDLEKRTRKRSEPEQLERKLEAIKVLRKRLMASTA